MSRKKKVSSWDAPVIIEFLRARQREAIKELKQADRAKDYATAFLSRYLIDYFDKQNELLQDGYYD